MSRDFYDYDRAREFARQDWIDLQIEDAEAKQRKAEPVKPELPPLVVRPGSQWAAAAYKQGREDEWINAMQARYGDLYD